MIKSNKNNKKKKGFTLVELIAVIAIIGILAAVLVPKISGYIQESKTVEIKDLARHVVTAVESYNIKNDTPMAEGTNASDVPALVGNLLDGIDVTKLGTATVTQCRTILLSTSKITLSNGVFQSVSSS